MRVLALDTASPFPALALVEVSDTGETRERIRPLPQAAAEAIAPRLAELLQDAGTSAGSLTCVTVLNGPGSFTGLRAGLAFARGLARALGVPLRLIGTFRAASNAFPEPVEVDFLLDAGRGDVYRARRRRGGLSEDLAPVPAVEALDACRAEGVAAIDLGATSGALASAAGRLALRPDEGSPSADPAYGRKSAAEEKMDGGRP